MAEQTNTTVADQTQAADMDAFKATPYYQGLGIEELRKQLEGYQTDDAALRTQAENQYKPTYDAEVEALRQQLAQQVQGYENQLSGLGTQYERQRRSTKQAYDESAVNLNNTLTSRGLGRSSLVSTQGAYLENQRNQALGDIDRTETDAINAINEQIALLTDQAAQSERTLSGNYARQLENRVSELKAQNQSASISLQLQIAALQQQGYEAYQKWLLENRAQELDEREFEIKYGEGQSGSASSGSGGKTQKSSPSQSKSTVSDDQQTGGVLPAFAKALGSIAQQLGSKVSKSAAEAMQEARLSGRRTGK